MRIKKGFGCCVCGLVCMCTGFVEAQGLTNCHEVLDKLIQERNIIWSKIDVVLDKMDKYQYFESRDELAEQLRKLHKQSNNNIRKYYQAKADCGDGDGRLIGGEGSSAYEIVAINEDFD